MEAGCHGDGWCCRLIGNRERGSWYSSGQGPSSLESQQLPGVSTLAILPHIVRTYQEYYGLALSSSHPPSHCDYMYIKSIADWHSPPAFLPHTVHIISRVSQTGTVLQPSFLTPCLNIKSIADWHRHPAILSHTVHTYQEYHRLAQSYSHPPSHHAYISRVSQTGTVLQPSSLTPCLHVKSIVDWLSPPAILPHTVLTYQKYRRLVFMYN